METKVQRWGNSLGLRIPKAFAKDLRLSAGADVRIRIEGGSLVVSPAARPKYTLQQLLKGITRKNRHGEVFPAGRKGKELI